MKWQAEWTPGYSQALLFTVGGPIIAKDYGKGAYAMFERIAKLHNEAIPPEDKDYASYWEWRYDLLQQQNRELRNTIKQISPAEAHSAPIEHAQLAPTAQQP